MNQRNHGITVIEVENLGQNAIVVNTSGPRLLLLDAALTHEQRIEIMNCVLDRDAA